MSSWSGPACSTGPLVATPCRPDLAASAAEPFPAVRALGLELGPRSGGLSLPRPVYACLDFRPSPPAVTCLRQHKWSQAGVLVAPGYFLGHAELAGWEV